MGGSGPGVGVGVAVAVAVSVGVADPPGGVRALGREALGVDPAGDEGHGVGDLRAQGALIKVVAKDFYPWHFFDSSWNVFDFWIVFVSLVCYDSVGDFFHSWHLVSLHN